MQKLLAFLLLALVFEAMGVVYLSQGLKQLREPAVWNPRSIAQFVVQGATNRPFVAGVVMETTFFVMLLILLRRYDVSLIWPLTSLGFVLTTCAARFIRHEDVSSLRWSGVILIMLGATLVGWSEQSKKPAASPPTHPARP
jgi:drug/metabolite transporter (DMT)-like permease